MYTAITYATAYLFCKTLGFFDYLTPFQFCVVIGILVVCVMLELICKSIDNINNPFR